MLGADRIVPKWKNLKSQICQKLQMSKELPEAAPGTPVLLSDSPSVVYQVSRHPHLMPRICFYPTATANVFVCFSWGSPGVKQDQARVWLQPVAEESAVVEKDVPMAQRVKVLQVSHVPGLRLLATYCDDLHLRLFGDHSQGLRLLAAVRCPHSVTSMCYEPETGELVTGAIGAITFWGFRPGAVPGLGVAWAVSVAGGELVHGLSVEREVRALVALCESSIRLYDCQRRAETRALPLGRGATPTCCSAHGPQAHLYVGDLAGHVALWSLETGRQEQRFKAHRSAVTGLACRPAARTLLTASLDGQLREWGLGTCEPLRRLDLGEPLLQLGFVGEGTFYCRSQHGFSLRTLRHFYRLFHAAGAGLRRLARLPCGPGRARILAATEDGVTRFLSPVTGELLLLTWPFQRLEKALDCAYDPEREELVVTVGTADVYILDTTTCPSPAKYVLRTAESGDDAVLCLAFCRLGLGTQPAGFVFSGHRSGHVRLVSQHAHRLAERQIHNGGVGALCSLSAGGDLSYHSQESNCLCSYGADERIVLSSVGLAGSELALRPLLAIPSTGCRIQSLLLLPGYLCALTEQNRLRLWRQAALVPRKINPYWLETGPLHSCPVTSLDYCHLLRLLLTGGADGSVRVWSLTGALLVDFDTSLTFSHVCFASLRGDLLVGCGTNIYFISCLEYLPRRHLKALAARQVGDDVLEDPLPFLPHFLLSFDTVFVPKYLWVGEKCYQGMEALTSHRAVTLLKTMAGVVASAKTEIGASHGPEAPAGAPELASDSRPTRPRARRPLLSLVEPPSGEVPQAPGKPVPLLLKHFLPGGPWLIRQDGYVPNSTIRAQLWPLGTPPHLQCSLRVTPRRRLPPREPVLGQEPASASRWWEEPAEKEKAERKPREQPTCFVDTELPRDVLAEIVASSWLRQKPSEVTLESVLRAVLGQLAEAPLSGYGQCTAALVQIGQAYVLPPQLRAEAAARLYPGTASENGQVRRAAWQTLGEMQLLSFRDVVPLARALLDPDRQVRDLARSLIASAAGITDKLLLQKAIKRQATPSQEHPTVTISGTELPRPEAEGLGWAPARLSVSEVESLLAQVGTRLTDTLELAGERPEPRARGQGSAIKWPTVSELLGAGAGGAEPTQALANRLQLVEPTRLPGSSGATTDAPGTKKQRHLQDKLPLIQPGARHLKAPIIVPSGQGPGTGGEGLGSGGERLGPGSKGLGPGSEGLDSGSERLGPGSEGLGPGSSRLGSGSERLGPGSSRLGSGSERLGPGSEGLGPGSKGLGPGSSRLGSGSERLGPGSKGLGSGSEAERRRGRAGTRGSLSPEGPTVKLPKVGQPPHGPHQDPRSKLYQEMLKRQMRKQPGGSLSSQPSQPSSQALGSDPSDPSLIDPGRRYSADSSRWRYDLCQLLNLRLSPSAHARGSLEELLVATRLALGQSSSSVLRGLPQSRSAAEELADRLATRLEQEAEGAWAEGGLAEGGLAKGADRRLAKGGDRRLAKGVDGGLAKGADRRLAKGVDRGLAKGVDGGLAKGVDGGLAKGADRGLVKGVDGGLAKGADRGLAEGGLGKGVDGGLAEGGLAERVDRDLAEGADGGLAKGAQAEGADGGLAKGAQAEGADGGLAEGGLAEGADGGLAKGADGGLAEGGLAKRADGGLAKGAQAEGADGAQAEGADRGLAEGAEQRPGEAPVVQQEELPRGSRGAVAGGVEGQVWQRLRPLLEILADPARLEGADSAELLGRLQALGHCPSLEHRAALEATLAMAAQVLGEQDAGLARAVSLCALLASPGQELPEATVSTGLLQAQPGPAQDLLASARARLQASAERMGQEWAWWEQLGQPSLEPAGLGEGEETQPPAWRPGSPQAQQPGEQEQEKPVPVASPREKVDLYLPGGLPAAGAGWAEVGACWLPSEDVFLALYQVLVALQQRHGPFSPAWWEQFRRLTELYRLQRPLSHALVRQLGAADGRSGKSHPGLAQARREAQGQSEASLGQRILSQVLHRGPRTLPGPPSFCGVIPLSYQNNVHPLRPRGEAWYGALALAWGAAQQDDRGQPPKLHLGLG